jgi:hypothetical protein
MGNVPPGMEGAPPAGGNPNNKDPHPPKTCTKHKNIAILGISMI